MLSEFNFVSLYKSVQINSISFKERPLGV